MNTADKKGAAESECLEHCSAAGIAVRMKPSTPQLHLRLPAGYAGWEPRPQLFADLTLLSITRAPVPCIICTMSEGEVFP